jgi:HEAT repeat protein
MLRGVGAAVLVLAGAGVWVGVNATELRSRYAAQRLASATTDEERAQWADTLAGYGELGVRHLVGCVQTSDEPICTAATAALEKYLTNLPDGDPRAGTAGGALLDAFPDATPVGQRAVLRLVPLVLKRGGPAHAMRCRGTVAEGLKAPDFETRLVAVRLTIHPDIRLRAEVTPLLTAPEPELRSAALFAVASAGDGETVINDEDLFRWLHDPDAGVRKVCRDALVARDRSDAEIALGRRLTHADPNERLKLLLDLRYDDDVADPEPWLERLSRDPEPAVRAGAARVAVEVAAAHMHPCPTWVARVADADPHPTVRFIAEYYRSLPTGAPRDQVRPVNGP